MAKLRRFLKKLSITPLKYLYPTLYKIESSKTYVEQLQDNIYNCEISTLSKVYSPATLIDVKLGDFSYIAQNSYINVTEIGKFCSIGPNVRCAWGIHPTDGISTSPVFYSTKRQCGSTFSDTDKVVEVLPIKIGNDVLIGMDVTILNGVTIGDGAVIGAGAVVSKDIPPYAVAYGNPIRINRYRFDQQTVQMLLKIKWWDFGTEALQEIEKNFFEIEFIIKTYS
jgi:acetyltransferase-like isoleucine patch superfamily enzyme